MSPLFEDWNVSLNINDFNDEFHGIIYYLKYTKGIDIRISSTPSYDDDFPVTNILIFEETKKFYIAEEKSTKTICFDFGIYSVQPSHYSIMTTKYLIDWTIEVSKNNENWEIIDEHVNSTSFVISQLFKLTQELVLFFY